jgi:hypothetical protein
MKTILTVMLIAIVATIGCGAVHNSPPAPWAQTALVGKWMGTLTYGSQTIPMTLTVTEVDPYCVNDPATCESSANLYHVFATLNTPGMPCFSNYSLAGTFTGSQSATEDDLQLTNVATVLGTSDNVGLSAASLDGGKTFTFNQPSLSLDLYDNRAGSCFTQATGQFHK